MAQGYHALTEKEKQTLRLMLRGHDAKSLARQLGLSVHTVNERLRDARRKLAVTSSREAARLVFDAEGAAPDFRGDTQIGDAVPAQGPESTSSDALPRTKNRFIWGIAGVAAMSMILAALALASMPSAETDASRQSPATAAAAAVAETDASRAARAWLVLGDEGRWEDGWRATAASFQQLNTAATWAEVSSRVRGPLGAVHSRTLLGQDTVPAPPAGVQVVRFRTDFAKKSGVVETVSLAREDGAWKIVGVYMD